MTMVTMDRADRLAPVMLSLLGGLDLVVDNIRAPLQGGGKVEALLTYLALARRRPLLRSVLLERLWPEHAPSQASTSLNSLVYQINKVVRQGMRRLAIIIHDNGYYALNSAPEVGVDIAYFEAWSDQGRQFLRLGATDAGIAYCERALALYRGDLVGASDIQTVIERESLRVRYLELNAALADCYAAAAPARALPYLERLLRHDPCREDAHRLAMRCYVRLNQRTKALRQYQLCRQILASEFDTVPEQETITLFNQIRLDPTSI
ncbi:MAG: hypothetical protein HGA19_02995 [Oscillochloris sp.]|nr:hypothetical protein [Oscillochloris sp.]